MDSNKDAIDLLKEGAPAYGIGGLHGGIALSLRQALIAVSALLSASYLGINIIASLPGFLIAENLMLALLYALGVYLLAKNDERGYPYLLMVASFNGGRVSRSIITPYGEIGKLAAQHVPLLALILATAFLALIGTINVISSQKRSG